MSSPRSFSLEDAARAHRVERLWVFWAYAEGRARDTIGVLLADLAASADWSEEQQTQFFACASTTWPARQATRAYVEEHPESLWREILERVTSTTRILLQRLYMREEVASLDRILRSPLAEFALHEVEREELSWLRPWAEAVIWRKEKNRMQALIAEWTQKREQQAQLFQGKKTNTTEWSLFERQMVDG
jgi:hypothetical protein